MLEQISLQNLALSVQAEVDFSPGMICITGETGAGKSLIVDALCLVLGAKADANMVRQGQKQLEVSAQFSIGENKRVKALLDEYGFLPNSVSAHTEDESAHDAISDAALDQMNSNAEKESSLEVGSSLGEDDRSDSSTPTDNVVGETGVTDNNESHIIVDGQADSYDENGLAAAGIFDLGFGKNNANTAESNYDSNIPLAANDDENDDLVLRRIVTAEGKSKAYVNGHLANLTQLREISEHLVAIHGQHASVRLMDNKNQLEIVDNFGKLKPLVAQVNELYNLYSKKRSELVNLSELQKIGAREYKQDRFELDELRRLDLKEGDYEELEAMFDRAMNQAQFQYVLMNLHSSVSGNDNNIISILRSHQTSLDKVKAFDPNISKIIDNLEYSISYLEDSVGLVDDITSQEIEMSSTELEGRMSKVHELARRFNCQPKDLYLMAERVEHKVNEFLGLKDKILNMTEEVKDIRKRYEELATVLTTTRRAVAKDLATKINDKIKALALPDASFDINLERDEESKPKLNGRDNLCFMFSANIGQDLRPLADVASGGELSRLALTIEVLTASVKSTPTLIFDEVDTGISGRTASAVGALLKELGKYVQVITVTHLPQVAASADTQFLVSKFNENGQVNSTLTVLDREGRITEISRMIGGDVQTESTRQSACELLDENDHS